MTELPFSNLGERSETIDRFQRFTELTHLQVSDPEARVEALHNLDPDKFLDLLAVSNGLLRGKDKFQRWSGEAAPAVVMNGSGGVELEPPEQSHELFKLIYKKLVSEITPNEEDLQKAAVEMYFAIIGTHLFGEGNGRTARAAYHLIKYGELPKEQSDILERKKGIVQAAIIVNHGAIRELLDREGLQYNALNDLAADDKQGEDDETFMLNGAAQQTKYIAARRVMLHNNEWPEVPPTTLKLKDWPEDKLEQFYDEYRKVREEWLAAFIDTAGKYTLPLARLIEVGPK